MDLRNKHVTKKNNPIPNEFEFEVPKDIRAESVRDLVKNYKTAFTNLKRNNIQKFNLGYKKKNSERDCIVISKHAIKPQKKKKKKRNSFRIYPRFLGRVRFCNDKKTLKNIDFEYNCRILYDRHDYYLIIPLKRKLKQCKSINTCALDPGVRTFQTMYSPNNVISISIRKDLKRKLYLKIDHLKSLKAKNLLSESKFKYKYYKIQKRIENLIDDMQYKLIHYLIHNFNTIHIPKFETQRITSKLYKSSNRDLLCQKHYTFRTRLEHSKLRGQNINICNESYTSKTCTNCGELNHELGSSKVFKCKHCSMTIDRDINGARNIFLKHL